MKSNKPRVSLTQQARDGLHDVPRVREIRPVLDPGDLRQHEHVEKIDFAPGLPDHGLADLVCSYAPSTLDFLGVADLQVEELFELGVEQQPILEMDDVAAEDLLHLVSDIHEADVATALDDVDHFGGDVVEDLVVERVAGLGEGGQAAQVSSVHL